MEDIYKISKSTKENYTVVVKVHNFSNESIHCPKKILKGRFRKIFNQKNRKISQSYINYEISDQTLKGILTTTVFANGNNDADEGYVSIMFRLNHAQFDVDRYVGYVNTCELFTCIVSIKDALGNKKIPQSCTFLKDFQEKFFEQFVMLKIDKYISRKKLLEEQSELLPQDTLTLHIDIIFKHKPMPIGSFSLPRKLIVECIETKKFEDGVKYYLFLDSFVGHCFYNASNYFKRVSDSFFSESKERLMHIPTAEVECLLEIGHILSGGRCLSFKSVHEILNLYTIADKYDIPVVTDTCLEMLKEYISAHNAENDILKMVDEHYHGFDHLKDSIKIQLTKVDRKTDKSIQLAHRLSRWRYDKKSNLSLVFSKCYVSIPTEEANDSEELEFDFWY